MTNLAQLETIDINEILKTNEEAREWLLENIDQIESLLGIELYNPRACFIHSDNANPDIIAEENMTDKKVVCLINLDTPTDKDFKRLLSASTALNASIAIWIVSEIDDQTKGIIHWLNHRTEWKTQFIIAKIEGYKIGNSLPSINLARI